MDSPGTSARGEAALASADQANTRPARFGELHVMRASRERVPEIRHGHISTVRGNRRRPAIWPEPGNARWKAGRLAETIRGGW